MRFRLTTTKIFYQKEELDKYIALGFSFKTMESGEKFCINDDEKVYVEINAMEELMAIIKKTSPLVIDEDSIEIYNDYRE